MERTWRWFGKNDKITLDMLRQIGVEGIVTALHDVPNGEVWTREKIRDLREYIESYGMRWSVVESLPVSESIKYAGDDRDRLIENYKAVVGDIVDNPKHLEILELEAPQLPRSLDDVAISVINAGYAKAASLDTKTALATEDNTSPYVNIIAAREQDKENPTYQKFVKIFQSEDVKKYINDNFSDGLVPAF